MKILFIIYNNDSYIHYFPLGTAYLMSYLKQFGHNVDVLDTAARKLNDESITNYLDEYKYDFVCMGMVAGYYQYRKLISISNAINASKNRKNFTYILGGQIVSPEPEYFLELTKADIIVSGEGELILSEIINSYPNYRTIPNITYKWGNKIVSNEKTYPLVDINTIPIPDYNSFDINYYRLQRYPNISNNEFSMGIITGRGCSFHCNFCYKLVPGIRLRNISHIVDEILFLKNKYNISYFDFTDDLTMASKERMEDLCNTFIEKGLNIKWRCEGRLNFVTPEILKLMKKAGCVFINYGIESVDNTVLKNMNKALTYDTIIKGINYTIQENISPGLNIIWGNLGDNLETLEKSVKFLLDYDDGSQIRTIRPVTPYPGCPLYKVAIERNLLKDVKDFYENKHVNSDLLAVNFTDLSDDAFHNALYEANKKLLKNYYSKKMLTNNNMLYNLYVLKDTSFRGMRHT